MNFWEWRSKKAEKKRPVIPPYKHKDIPGGQESSGEPMIVEESTASDSMIARALKFWKKED